MDSGKYYRLLLKTQGLYTTITALWPLADMKSFIVITGPKTDGWLVETVSLLLLAIGITFLSSLVYKRPLLPIIILGIFTSAGLVFIDFYYTSNGRIKWVYAVDGAVETFFLLVWIYLLITHRRLPQVEE